MCMCVYAHVSVYVYALVSNGSLSVTDGGSITAPLNYHLATNIKTTQSLLNALAKIPANSNSTPAMRNLARVLASPLRPQGAVTSLWVVLGCSR